jgi:hypothetical protein
MMIAQGCLAWEDIEERKNTPINDSPIPILLDTAPELSQRVVQIYRNCQVYKFEIEELVDARDGTPLTRQDVFINWFIDYETTTRNPFSGTSFRVNINSDYSSEPAGSQHIVDLRISDQDFLTEGEGVRVNWDTPEGANVEDHFWIIEIVDDNFNDPNCERYIEE